jgi:hypothetical protein
VCTTSRTSAPCRSSRRSTMIYRRVFLHRWDLAAATAPTRPRPRGARDARGHAADGRDPGSERPVGRA